MEMNFLVLGITALIPLVIGFVWYGPLLFQNAWMKQLSFTRESLQGGNMALIFGLCFIFSFLLAIILQTIVIHQMGVYSSILPSGSTELTGEELTFYNDFMAKYGQNYRTFKHGALHGTLAGLFLVTPILAIQAMFERKSAKYIFINAGYWTVTLALMGGVICQFG